MKVLVFSDSHGRTGRMLSLIQAGKPDAVLHLGDHAGDVEEVRFAFPTLPCCVVSGNNDWGPEPMETVLEWEGVRMLCTHGHQLAVSRGPQLLAARALQLECRAALFGHTHRGFCQEVGGVLAFNPGSISLPRDGTNGSYGILQLEQGRIRAQIIALE